MMELRYVNNVIRLYYTQYINRWRYKAWIKESRGLIRDGRPQRNSANRNNKVHKPTKRRKTRERVSEKGKRRKQMPLTQ